MDFSKPRVAIYYYVVPQTNMRNDGPPLFANIALRKILNNLDGLESIKKDLSDDRGNVVHLWPTKEAEKMGTFDLHLWVDHGEDALDVPLKWIPPSPNAYWVSDAHLGYEYRLGMAKKFDKVFCCQRQFIDQFKKDGVDESKLFYLPHAVDPTCYRYTPIIEKWDWCFIGHMNSNKRIDLVDAFSKEWPAGEKGYIGWRIPHVKGWNVLDDAAYKFSQSKIVLNDSIKDDINMRIFEALSTKRCLLTERTTYLDELFLDGVHLVTFSSIGEAIEKARELLKDDEKRKVLGEQGQKEILSKHTYVHRMKDILEIVLNYIPEGEKEDAIDQTI